MVDNAPGSADDGRSAAAATSVPPGEGPQQDHPCFAMPPPDTRIWRYMELSKLCFLLLKGQLYFSRADRLGDPFEGTLPRPVVELAPAVNESHGIPKQKVIELLEFFTYMRQWTYISCWHISDQESAALWRVYGDSRDAVAIQTTAGRLRGELPPDVLIGSVGYIDYNYHIMPINFLYWPFLYKRREFAYEQELRAVDQVIPDDVASRPVAPELGKCYSVNPGRLIQAVYVSPLAGDWLEHTLIELLNRCELTIPLYHSELARAPFS